MTTKTNMATRLRAIAAELQSGPADSTVVKMIFDLKGAATHLDDLDTLLGLVQEMDEDLCKDGRPVKEELVRVAAEIRERKSKGSDPEPKMG